MERGGGGVSAEASHCSSNQEGLSAPGGLSLMLNWFSVCSSCCWLPAKYAEMALWKRRSCLCMTFTWRRGEGTRRRVNPMAKKALTFSLLASYSMTPHLVLLQELQFDGDIRAEALKFVLLCLILLLSSVDAGHGHRIPRTQTQLLQVGPVGIKLQSAPQKQRGKYLWCHNL